jgi:cytochrome c553
MKCATSQYALATPMRLALLTCFVTLPLWSAAALAQTSDNPVTGQALFENTRTASGKTSISMSCTACHNSVENRRIAVSLSSGGLADPYADISFDSAMTRLSDALQNQGAMAQFRVLDPQQVRDIAAYIADTPKTTPASETQLNFTAAVNGFSAAQTVRLKHATATSENLQIVSVAAIGIGQANFVVQPACNNVTLTPANSCSLTVTYAPANSTLSTPDLVFTLRQGPSTNTTFERVLFLNGSVASTTPPADDSGGGALGLGWLAALGLAVAAQARRRG